MIHTAELAKAVARTEQARQKKAKVLDMIMRSINETEALIAQLGKQNQDELNRALEIQKENVDLRQKNNVLRDRNAALNKELMDERSRANRMESELREQIAKNQEVKQYIIHNQYGCIMAAEAGPDEDKCRGINQNDEERAIPFSTILSFGSTRMTQEAVQTVVDLLYFAINDRTPEEEKNIKKLMADFRKVLRPQMDVKDSTQNFYMK
jgi:hypothetical protein